MKSIAAICFMLLVHSLGFAQQNNAALYEKFYKYYKEGKVRKSEAVMEKIKSNNGKTFVQYMDYAAQWMEQNQPDSAYGFIRASINVLANPAPSTDAFYKERNKRYAWSVGVVEQLLKKKDSCVYFGTLGFLYDELSDQKKALRCFTEAIKRDSSATGYYYSRATIYRQSGYPDSAILDYNAALRIDPKYAAVYLNRGFAYLVLENYEKAIYDFERVPRYTEDQMVVAYSYSNLGYAHYKLHKLDKAEEFLNHSLRVYPSNPYVYRNLALVALEREERSKACQHIAKSLELGFTNQYGNEVLELQQKHCR